MNKTIYNLYKNYVYHRNKFLCRINPKLAANFVYKKVFNKSINWEDPQDLIEKIAWLEINSDTSLWTLCADKYRVRDFVTQRGCKNILVDFYGKWDDPDDIDFDKLPNRFVLKTNNGCGTIMIVKDKDQLDRSKTRKLLKQWLSKPFGYASAQLHYLDIKRCVIAEELLIDERNPERALTDYKIWCFNGTVESILVVSDRKGHNGKDYKLSFFDTEWNNISQIALSKNSKHYGGDDVARPENLEEMIHIAQILSKGFPEVRVDLYNLNGKLYFGELTFSTGFGTYSYEYYKYLGSKIDLSLKTQDI